MIKEFKEFISKGNVLDLAVGIIIGGAFGKIVSSLVNDVIMPLLAALLGESEFSLLSFNLNGSEILYGSFIQNIIDFLVIGFVIFIVIKFLNKFKKKEFAKETVIVKSNEEKLLEEIRDLLKKKK
jgi:large conductance mechanosensitive channel